ncbi:PAS domain S-box protein [Paraflavisolibacter sp. H34]|uniref:PAS domain S-box protein n=1 Tax=Huijunlia imazamoxiresistens TaxID=3127457 RepID=UPI00301801F2
MTPDLHIEALQQQLRQERQARQEAEHRLADRTSEWQQACNELERLRHQFDQELERQTADIKSLALFAVQYPEPLIRINFEGEVIAKNVSATFLHDFYFGANYYPAHRLWALIAKFVQHKKSDWQLEVSCNDRLYLFMCSPNAKNDFINIYGKDITQERKVFEEMQWLSLVASANANGVIFTGTDGNISWANEGFSKLTGYSESEALGKNLFLLCCGPNTCDETLEKMQQRFSEGKPYYGEVIQYRRDGSRFWARCNGQPIQNGFGEVTQYFTVVEDITVEKEQEVKLIKREERYRSIIANVHLGLAEMDLDGRIRFVNQQFCAMSGYSSDELQGAVVQDLLFHEAHRPAAREEMEKRRRGISGSYEVAVVHKQGDTRWWMVSGAPLYSDEGVIIGAITVFLNITEQKVLEKKLRDASKAAQDSVRAKENFLANMSHEIRTPMNAVLGMLQLLQKTSLDEEQRMYLKTIHHAARNLLVIINDILDFSKIHAGKVSLETIGFDLRSQLEQAIFSFRYKAEGKGLGFSVSIDERIEKVLLGDPYRLNQILMNLLSNAVKFTEKGSVHLSCRVLSEENGGQSLLLQVTDTGIGMDEGYLRSLFEKFTQEDENVARRYGGTGLGMTITKELVEMMKGTIEVSSKKNAGTNVTLRLAFRKGTEADLPRKEEKIIDIGLLRGKRILLAEDNQMNRMVVNAMLHHYGVQVAEAVNGLEAIDRLRYGGPFDLVLMDVQMPEMDGLEATFLIRESVNATIPIIALTANAISGEMEKCLQAGMNGYLSKPFEAEDLLHLIAKWVGHEGELPLILEETAAQPAGLQHPLFNLAHLRTLSRGNEEFVRKMQEVFIREVPATLTGLREAYLQDDLKQVKALAHRIKPSVDNMGIVALKGDLRRVEELAQEGSKGGELEMLLLKLERILSSVVRQMTGATAEEVVGS